MFGCPAACLAEHPNAVRVIDHYPCSVFFCKCYNVRERSDISFHTEYAVNDDQFVFGLIFFQYSFEIRHIIVPELSYFTE